MIDAEAAFGRIGAQLALGPRFVGSPGHAAAVRLLWDWLATADRRVDHEFEASFFGKNERCHNLWGHFEGDRPGRLLLGSHFDTRPWADQDPDPARRKEPVPGANDGASGIALLAELAPQLAAARDRPSIDLVFFDAEDWHEIDTHEVSLGARRFVADLADADIPDSTVIVDMVAGRELMLDVDVSCEDHSPSFSLALQIFQLGNALRLPAFAMKKSHPYKWVTDDHIPFMRRGIPACLLIDLDYAPWHTTADTLDACSPKGLGEVGLALEALIWGDASLDV